MPPASRKSAAHIALLRGINVGGKNKLPMKALAQHFEHAGCDNVRTYIQSGNVIFEAPPEVAKRVPADISGVIKAKHKLSVPVIVRTAAEWRAAIKNNPFLRKGIDESALHVAFLANKPTKQRAAALDPARSPGDEFALRGCELYLHLPNGVARSKITNAYMDKMLGTVSTSRNWRTVLKLAEMINAGD